MHYSSDWECELLISPKQNMIGNFHDQAVKLALFEAEFQQYSNGFRMSSSHHVWNLVFVMKTKYENK